MNPKTVWNQCKKHGKTVFVFRKSENRYRCRKCCGEAVSKRRRGLKDKLINHFGGKCVKCGYDKCKGALSFHHLDPNKKDFKISDGRCRSFENNVEEASKCILVCSNCHAEIHEELKQSAVTQSVEWLAVDGSAKQECLDENRVNSGEPKSQDKAILSQTEGTPSEGAETSGEVKPS